MGGIQLPQKKKTGGPGRVKVFIDLRAKRSQSFISKFGYRSSVVIGRRLRTSDDNDLEHVMNTDNTSLETCPFATFRSPPTFYNLYKLFFYID